MAGYRGIDDSVVSRLTVSACAAIGAKAKSEIFRLLLAVDPVSDSLYMAQHWKLAMEASVDREKARELILSIYAARRIKDYAAMAAVLHPDVVYRMNVAGSPATTAFRGPQGRESTVQTVRQLREQFVFEDDWKEELFAHDGDVSLLVWRATVTFTQTRKSQPFEVTTVYTWKDGLIHTVTENTDTAALAVLSSR